MQIKKAGQEDADVCIRLIMEKEQDERKMKQN